MIDLNSLVIFATVVDASSFSEAARRLKMPVSTVSRRIAELEDQLGVRLLERSTRNLSASRSSSPIAISTTLPKASTWCSGSAPEPNVIRRWLRRRS
jgi:hypothetical protein